MKERWRQRRERVLRRRPYRQKPDLPGMTKRKRGLGGRDGYWIWSWGRYRFAGCPALIRRRPKRQPQPTERRELKPRPPHRRNRRAYHRGQARAEQAEIIHEWYGSEQYAR